MNDTNDTNKATYKKIFKRETKIIALVVICLTLAALGTSYAVFLRVNNNSVNQVVQAGSLSITYLDKNANPNGNLTLTSDDDDKNCLAPKADEEGKVSGCEIKFSITNAGSLPAEYHLLIYNDPKPEPIEGVEDTNLVALSNFKSSLTKQLTVPSPEEKEQVEQDTTEDGQTEAIQTLDKLEKYTADDGATGEYIDSHILETAKIGVGETYEFSLRIWLIDSASKELIGKQVGLKLGVVDIVYENETAGDIILASMGQPKGIHEIMPTPSDLDAIDSDENPIKIREFRYSGPDPDNYVSFNCSDDTTCEKWRILGVTEEDKDGTTERTVRLVKSNENDTQAYQPSNGLTQLESIYATLNPIAQNQIVETDYKIGTISNLDITGSQALDMERESGTSESTNSHLGILSLSDYVLASTNGESTKLSEFISSSDNNYLFKEGDEWLLTKDASTNYYTISGSGHKILAQADPAQSYNAHIVVTLNKDVKITGGDGTKDNPYKLSN